MVFATPWEGDAVIAYPWYLRFVPGTPRGFRFRTEIRDVHGDTWTVEDTTTLPDGTVQRRTMRSRLLAPGRIELTAEDMPGGARVRTRADGFDFDPYVIRTPVLGPLRVPLRYHDSVDVDPAAGVLTDTIVMRFLGFRVATIVIRLRRRAT